jgi:hypothetical protein
MMPWRFVPTVSFFRGCPSSSSRSALCFLIIGRNSLKPVSRSYKIGLPDVPVIRQIDHQGKNAGEHDHKLHFTVFLPPEAWGPTNPPWVMWVNGWGLKYNK